MRFLDPRSGHVTAGASLDVARVAGDITQLDETHLLLGGNIAADPITWEAGSPEIIAVPALQPVDCWAPALTSHEPS